VIRFKTWAIHSLPNLVLKTDMTFYTMLQHLSSIIQLEKRDVKSKRKTVCQILANRKVSICKQFQWNRVLDNIHFLDKSSINRTPLKVSV